MKIDIKELDRLHKEKLLEKQVHPILPLTIWNYSQTCQYDNLWTSTLLMCRGLVTDVEGNVIARPFKKFFNLEEKKHVHTENFTIWHKEDGSLGIIFFYNGVWHICSRGSFTSDQAIKAKEMLEKIKDKEKYLKKELTYLVEIIYPENRICIDYGQTEKLILLGAVDIETGAEVNPTKISQCIFEIPQQEYFTDYSQIAWLDWENKEGFVVHFDNGNKCKIKFANYLKKHKIIWNLTNKLIHEHLVNGNIEELLDQIPDEFYSIVKEEIYEFNKEYAIILSSAMVAFIDARKLETRKEFAAEALKYEYPQVLFAMLDKKNYEGVIWKILEPKVSIRILTK